MFLQLNFFFEKPQKTKKPEDFSPGKKKNDAEILSLRRFVVAENNTYCLINQRETIFT